VKPYSVPMAPGLSLVPASAFAQCGISAWQQPSVRSDQPNAERAHSEGATEMMSWSMANSSAGTGLRLAEIKAVNTACVSAGAMLKVILRG